MMTIQPLHTILAASLAVVAATAIALACRRARLLTTGGATAAGMVGSVVFVCGGLGGAAALLTFFATSNLLGRFQREAKKQLGFEKGGQRDAWQVLANGGVAAMLLALACLPHAPAPALRVAFLAALAEANADTWATEIGAGFGWPARMITTFRRALPGESGAISLPGTAAALAGAALIGLFALRAGHASEAALVTASGFAGALLDSVLGATLQAHYRIETPSGERISESPANGGHLARGIQGVNNDAVNLAATLFAAAAAWLLTLAAR